MKLLLVHAKHIGLILISNTPLQWKDLICSPEALRACIQLLWCSYPIDGVAPLEPCSFCPALEPH